MKCCDVCAGNKEIRTASFVVPGCIPGSEADLCGTHKQQYEDAVNRARYLFLNWKKVEPQDVDVFYPTPVKK